MDIQEYKQKKEAGKTENLNASVSIEKTRLFTTDYDNKQIPHWI